MDVQQQRRVGTRAVCRKEAQKAQKEFVFFASLALFCGKKVSAVNRVT
jgi:hypothetical protein